MFDKEWKDPTKNVLWKTTGYGAIIKAFPYLYERGAERKDLSQDYFMQCFENLKRYMQGMNKDFSNKFYSGGGEQLQNKLAEDIRRAQDSGL